MIMIDRNIDTYSDKSRREEFSITVSDTNGYLLGLSWKQLQELSAYLAKYVDHLSAIKKGGKNGKK
ncbi:MAG: hypothetical protein Q4D56_12820 [Bacteroides sp.]|nr:hypothetical protein [Bacteroides sp.]